MVLVVLGLGLRSYHFLRDSSIWCDEAAVIVNVLDKSYVQLLGPLKLDASGPPLFFWMEKAGHEWLGNSVRAWRLLPYLASCTALALSVFAAWQVLDAALVPWVVLILAVSDRMLWHSCEAKPYAVDACVAAAVMALHCFQRSRPIRQQLLVYLFTLPPLIFLSFPAAFVCAALLAALFGAVWSENRPGTWAMYDFLAMVIALGFLVLLMGPIHAQDTPGLRHYWPNQFPRWERPWSVPGWMVGSTFEMLRYCVKPTGGLLLPLAALGAVSLWRGGLGDTVVLATLPIALALAASLCLRYPFGHARVELFAAPAVALLIGAGVRPAYNWVRLRTQSRAIAVLGLGVLLLAPACLSTYRVFCPWPRADAARAAAYVISHRSPSDQVASDGWEFRYYCRSLRSFFGSWDRFNPASCQRVWVIMTHLNPNDEMPDVPNLPGEDWRLIERHRFQLTSVSLLARGEPRANEQMSSVGVPDVWH
jgi:hypothetical protein